MRMIRFPVVLALAGAALALSWQGCASVTHETAPKVNLANYHHFFVEHRLVDDHHVDEYIVQELQRLGLDASSGPLTMKPDNTDAIITYVDRWQWDFKTYMIEFTAQIYDARTDKPLARLRYYQPTVTSKDPGEVAHAVLAPLFTHSKTAKS